jgi:hypothetical protein
MVIYDIFMIMNISSIQSVSTIFQAISPVSRLEILLAIGKEEPCVCHLEATFGWETGISFPALNGSPKSRHPHGKQARAE